MEDTDVVDSTETKTSSSHDPAPPSKRPGSKAQGRKRTKTGCLTCRVRRIKCGEERPVCQNCTKSKRHCEGYNQRVVFKDPLNAYRPSLSTASHFPLSGNNSHPSTSKHRNGSLSQASSGQKATPIAPKPSGTFRSNFGSFDSGSLNSLGAPSTAAVLDERGHGSSGWESFSMDQQYPSTSETAQDHYKSHETKTNKNPSEQAAANTFTKAKELPDYSFDSTWSAGSRRQSQSMLPNSDSESQRKISAPANFYHSSATPIASMEDDLLSGLGTSTVAVDNAYTSREGLTDLKPHASQGTWNISQPWPLDQDQVDAMEADNDPYDVSDDDVEMEKTDELGVWQETAHDDHLKNNDLGIMVALQADQDGRGVGLRSFTSFIDRPDMLATYTPSSQSTPLQDPLTARIFCHFVNVTAPCISMFERHPANPSLIFQGEPVHKTQQHIWTYTFPTLALHNAGLLHAMLAMASLHIAKLQNGPITASYKHYALSLRRVAKSVSLPTRRGHPATLAAALLLAFYECWSADHQKWSNHLLGARQLIREIDFAHMTSYIKRKTTKDRYFRQQTGEYLEDTRFQPHVHEVDEALVGKLMGDQVRYEQYGQILDDGISGLDEDKKYTERDLEIYETQRDLFWWYCKQDTYQSILGGGRLFMEYSFWSHCPPRAPIGRLDAIYGTFDHLILLMGRLANYAARDLKRKRLAIKMNGGRWQPPESMRTPPQASQSIPTHGTPQTPKPPPIPGFSGMVPDFHEATLPMGFEPSRDTSPQSSTQSDDTDLQTQTRQAEEEWHDIRNAFAILEHHFGENFQALGPEYSPPIQTPFGPALQYRTFGIAGIWMNYYMGLTACYRAHPSMPPAAMMAAGISAQQTSFFANEIGRIAAGVAPDCSMTVQVSPTIGAALIESCQPLFVSGVQYRNAEQRSWTVCRLRDIARLTGWQSALAIVSGCESTWVKTGELGKGPPYTRTKEERVVPDIWSSSRRIDRAFDGKTSEERRLVFDRSDRVHYAMGILSLDEDFEKLDIDSKQ